MKTIIIKPNKKTLLKIGALIILGLGGLFLIHRVTMAANNTFVQTDWSSGISGDKAVHPTNQTGWAKYASKDTTINTAVAGRVNASSEALSVTDTTDTDFGKGSRSNVDISGTGTGASLILQSDISDPFLDNVGKWTSTPEIPILRWYSPFVKAGNYIYALWEGKTFGRFSIANETWEFMADTPAVTGIGCALAYPGSGDSIFALRGSGTKDFWKYSISGNTWTKLADCSYNVRDGSGLEATSTTVYCLPGYIENRRKFLAYDILGNSWTELSDTTYDTRYRARLVYPGSGFFLYLQPYRNTGILRRYNTSTAIWQNLNNPPSGITNLCYPGNVNGNYLYAWYESDSTRYFMRFDLGAGTWSGATDLPRVPVRVENGILYYPGSGNKLKLLSSFSYHHPLSFDTSTLKWDEPQGAYASNYVYYGGQFAWDGGDYIYKTYGDNEYRYFGRYSISNDTWESLADQTTSMRNYYGSDTAYYTGYLYATKGYNDTEFHRYNVSSNAWEALAVVPATVGHGGAISAGGDGYIYALRGNNQTNLWRYMISNNTWYTLASAPETVYVGGALCYPGTGDYIYASRGNNRPTFWRYKFKGPGSDVWEVMAPAPFNFYYKAKLTYPGTGNYIYAFFGWYNLFARYNFTTNTWESLEGTPDGQDYYYGAAAAGDKIYFAYSSNLLRELYTYTISTKTWSAKRYNNNTCRYFGSAVHTGGDDVYLFYGGPGDNVFKYSISGKRWTGLIKTPFLMYYGTKACYPGSGNNIYVLRGRGTRELWEYNFSTKTWTKKADAPFDISTNSQLGGNGDVLFACQGAVANSSGDMIGYGFAKYTISTNTWTQLADMPDYIPYHSYGYGNNIAHVPSAGAAGRVYTYAYEDPYLRVYDVISDSWTATSNTPSSVYLRAGSSVYYPGTGDDIYVATGSNYNTFLKYSISGNTWTKLSNPTLSRYAGVDSGMFKSGDFIYLIDGYSLCFAMYSITNDAWNTEVSIPYWSLDEAYSFFGRGKDGNTLYCGGYDAFYKYNISDRTWTSLHTTLTDLGWRWDEWYPHIVYPFSGDYLYSTRGQNRSNFARYSISGDLWEELAAPGNCGAGYQLAGTPLNIYFLTGGGSKSFKTYGISFNTWTDLADTPDTIYYGASLLYPVSGDYLYATRGNNSNDFYRYSISGNSWTALADTPVPLGGGSSTAVGGTVLAYPGRGDYIYLIPGVLYSSAYETNRLVFRYSISDDSWEEIESAPVGFAASGTLVYPGTGDYFYGKRGYTYQYDPIFKYLIFKQGSYTSDIKNIGRNQGYDTVSWSDNAKGSLEFKARTSDSSSMTGATDWTDVPGRDKGDDLSLSYPGVTDSDTYLQYKIGFFAYDLAELPAVNDLTVNYTRYPHEQSLVSSAYNAGNAHNRIMKLSWAETQLTGTDIRFKLRTAPDSSGNPGTWSAWLGPGGTQTFNNDYSLAGDYAYDSLIEVTSGIGRLKKIYENFAYTQRIILDNSDGSGSYTDSVFTIEIDSANDAFWEHVKSDGGDIRFADAEGNTLEYNCTVYGTSFDYANKTASIYVKIPSVPAAQKTVIYLVYGKADATSLSNEDIVPVPTSGLIGRWDFDEGTGTVAADSSPTGSDGTISTPEWVEGKFNMALRLTSSDTSNVRIEDTSVYDFGTGDFTISFWAKHDLVTSYNTYMELGYYYDGILIRQESTSQIRIWIDGPSYGWTFIPQLDTWYNIIFVRESGSLRLYVDGSQVGSPVTDNSNMRMTAIGYFGRSVHTTGQNFRGVMDQILFYNRALTTEEINQVSLGTSGGSVPTYFTTIANQETSPSLSGWEYREQFDIDNTQGGELSNYQVQINLTSAQEDFWSKCRNNGYDIRFVDSDNTTVLNYYRKSFDYANKTATLLVKVPSISEGSIKRIYLYYGKSDAADSSSFDNTLVKNFTEAGYENTSAVSLDGTGDSVTVSDSASLDITGAVTIEANIKYTADTWLAGFGYRKKITYNNAGGSEMTNEGIKFNVTYVSGKMNADFSDLRFVDTDGKSLKYRIMEYTASTQATVTVRIPTIPADSTKDFYMYYGNAEATSMSDSTYDPTSLLKFDSDNNGSIDSIFSSAYAYLVDASQVYLRSYTDNNWNVCYINRTSTFTRAENLTFQWQAYQNSSNGVCAVMMGWKDDTSTMSYTAMPYAIYLYGTDIYIYEDGTNKGVRGTFAIDTWYDFKIVLKATSGAKYYYKLSTSDTWTLLYNSGYSSATTLRPHFTKRGYYNSDSYRTWTKNWDLPPLVSTVAFASEEAQPVIDATVIGKAGAYEMKFIQSGLIGLINGSEKVSTANYEAGTWTHAALTYDGSRVKLYVDGSEKDSAELTGAITANLENLKIGEGVKGAIDEVRVWNVARAGGNINEDKYRYLNGTETGLVCFLRLNENGGSSASDATVNGNNGSLGGDAAWLAAPFGYTGGKSSVLYHMDEAFGTTTVDSSGLGNTVTLNDVSWFGSDLTGFSTGDTLVFNGTTAYASANDSAGLDVTGGRISIEAWVKPNVNTGARTIVVKGDNSQSRWNYRLYQAANTFAFSFYNGAERSHSISQAVITPGTTYHVVATFDETTDEVKIYVNATEKYSGTETSSMIANDDKLYLGRSASGANAFPGALDEVRIYKRVLPAGEVLRHYQHRLYAESEPTVNNVYEPPAISEIGVYATNHPVVQPVMGVFYTNKNIMQFQEISNKPWETEIKYQISNNGYTWYWHNGSGWVLSDGGYSQANTAAEVNTNLSSFQDTFTEGDFYYRAYLHADTSALRTPSLDNIGITLVVGDTYYTDPAGGTEINAIHTDADNDQWVQYKAILYSDGEDTPLLHDVTMEYIDAYVTVNTPNGGEEMSVGSSYNITWSSQAITKTGGNGLVNIAYSTDGGSTYNTIAEDVSNSGTYTWSPIPDDPAVNGLIKITSDDFPVLSDVSNAPFKILSLKVTSPNGGEKWERDRIHNITWSSIGAIPNNIVKIEFSTDGGSNWSTVIGSAPNSGTYAWTVPSQASDNCRIRISSPENSKISDISDAAFSTLPMPAITIESPAGGETWRVGDVRTLSWSTNQLQFSDNVKIEYSVDNFVEDINTIVESVSTGTPAGSNPNDNIDGSYDWTVADVNSSNLKIKITETTVPSGRDTQTLISKTSAALTVSEPSITVTSPQAQDIWVAGDTNAITWENVGGISDDLLLEYSTDGANYTGIATGEANDGSYDWTIPSEAVGSVVTVRITDNGRPTVQDISGEFEVLEFARVTVTQPNGGENMTIGTEYIIKWSTIGNQLEAGGSDYNMINLYYSANNGTEWIIIAYRTANTGSYNWTVADAQSSQALIKVKDDNDPNVEEDVSDAVFSIDLPSITVTSPNGGEYWYATGSYDITWTSVGTVSNNLKLEYSTDDGTTWNTIATAQANNGTYTWSSIADAETTNTRIRITDGSRPAITDTSDTAFSITAPTITISSPNGGEEFAVGSVQNITWTSVGYAAGAISDNLTIQYSSDGGTSWTDVATGEGNDNLYQWAVPDDISDNCRVKIFDASRSATADTSDGNFSIVIPYVELTAPNGGEQWPIGSQQSITWTSVGAVSDVLKIEYSKDNFATMPVTIATGEDDDGTYTWTVADDFSSTVKIRIWDTTKPSPDTNPDEAIYDLSNMSFAIVNPIVTLTAPNGGELWTVGDTENITWTNTGSVGNDIKLEYSKDNFVSDVNTITTSTTNTGSYAWQVPVYLFTTMRVRITDNTRSGVVDKSNANFSILPLPVITLATPLENDVWRYGTTKEITWTDNGGLISNNLTIRYSNDGGATWPAGKIIATGQANDGSYEWQIPDDISATCKVRISDPSRVATVDTSDAFQIAEPAITITSPISGVIWAVGDDAPVTWTTEGTVSDNLIMEYSSDGGTTYHLEKAGQANTKSYTWDIDDDAMSASARFRITDGNRPAVKGVSDSFIINSMPEIDVTSPNGGEEWVLGDARDITWGWTGLSISDNLLIESSNDNFVSTRQVIKSGVANTGTYSWTISDDSLTGATLKIRITDGNRTEITDKTDGFFRIRGGFTLNSPNGGEELTAKSTYAVSWQTKGNISYVKLDYSINDGTSWVTIAASVGNTGSYSWTLPDIQEAGVLLRVSDPTDPTVNDQSDAEFNIRYQTVQFKILDYDTLEHLADVTVNEPATGWYDTGLASPLDREATYPYGSYNTFFVKTNYIDNSVSWSPPKVGTDTYIITVYLENSASAQVTWEAILTYSFSPASDTLTAVGSLQRKGKLVGTTENERADMSGATLTIYEPGGSTVKHTLTSIAPNNTGMYNFTLVSTEFEAGYVYPATLAITYRERPYTSSASIDVGSEILQYDFFTKTAANLAASVTAIEAAVAGGTAEMKTAMTAVQSTLQVDTAQILSATQTALPASIADTKKQIETVMKSEILNDERTIRRGQPLVVRYRTYPGLSNVVVDVYDPNGNQKITQEAMEEISTGTGIYEKEITFSEGWGIGDFSIVCSDATYGSMDGVIITVGRYDMAQVASNVSSIMGTTSSLTNIQDIATSLDSQISLIESALKSVGQKIAAEVQNAVQSANEMEGVFGELSKLSATMKQVQTATSSLDLDKFYEIEEDKKEDMNYLKNKTQELKAMMDLNQQMIDNVANEPIVQTWYEYRSIVLKAVVVNPSDTHTKKVPFKAYLPKEAKPEDIMARGELKVAYDTQQGSYYVFTEFTLKPKETKEVDIELKDIWQIKPSEIESLRAESKKVHSMLKDTEFSERATFLATSIEENLNKVIENQKVKPVNPEDHISNYRENLELMQEAKADLSLARTLLSQTKPFSLAATWKLIVAIVIFLGLLSVGFYLMWQKQVRLSEVPTISAEEKNKEEKK